MASTIDVTRPLQRAAELESRRENVVRSFQVAAPLLPASSSLNLLARNWRQYNPSPMACRSTSERVWEEEDVPCKVVVVVTADIDRNHQGIVAGVVLRYNDVL